MHITRENSEFPEVDYKKGGIIKWIGLTFLLLHV